MATFAAFGDESGIHAASPCYTIGCFIVSLDTVGTIESGLSAILQKYGIHDELKWTKIGSFRARSLAAVEGIEYLLDAPTHFHAIVTNKSLFRKWQSGDREEAFYMTYSCLAQNVAKVTESAVALQIDARNDRYAKRAEVLQIVSNHTLRRMESEGIVESVEMCGSRTSPLLQFTDVLVGAINADTSASVDRAFPLNAGKRHVIDQLATLVGWDRLLYDTWPGTTFNVWHFPIQFRGPTAHTRFD